MYATISGLTEWSGTTTESLAGRDQNVERNLQGVETRIAAYIAPCQPNGHVQIEALEHATYAQYMHEQTDHSKQLMSMSGLMESFSLGHFSGTFAKGFMASTAELFPAGLSPSARAILRSAGLMYRGVTSC